MNNDSVLIATAIVIFALFVFGGFGMMGFPSGSVMYGFNYSGMWFFGWIFMILILVALVLFIAWLIKQLQKK